MTTITNRTVDPLVVLKLPEIEGDFPISRELAVLDQKNKTERGDNDGGTGALFGNL